jgi:hypothetical protein
MRVTRYGCVPLRVGLLAAALAASPAPALQALGVQSATALTFGRFASGAGGNVTVSPAGVRTGAGTVVLLSSDPGSAAQISLSGEPGQTYSIGLPADDAVTLTSAAGQAMPVRSFSSLPAAAGQLGAGGTQVLSIGATLVVAPHQAVGSYAGTFVVSLDYN